MKMSDPNSVITFSGNYKKSHEAKKLMVALAAEAVAAAELTEMRVAVNKDDIIMTKKQKLSSSFPPGHDTMSCQVHPIDPFKKAHIRTTLDPA
jgi:hypothetical protein